MASAECTEQTCLLSLGQFQSRSCVFRQAAAVSSVAATTASAVRQSKQKQKGKNVLSPEKIQTQRLMTSDNTKWIKKKKILENVLISTEGIDQVLHFCGKRLIACLVHAIFARTLECVGHNKCIQLTLLLNIRILWNYKVLLQSF